MVKPFAEWVRERRAVRKSRSERLSALREIDKVDAEIDDLVSELGSIGSITSSQYGRLVTRRAPSITDVRVQRLELEVVRLAEEVSKLADVVGQLALSIQSPQASQTSE